MIKEKCSYLVFSVYQSSLPESINQANHLELIHQLNARNISFKPLQGCYAGELEASVIIPNNGENLAFVKDMCNEYNQECYMGLVPHRHSMYMAFFGNTDWESFAGYLRSTDKETIDRLGLDYSYRPDEDTYFILWHSDNNTGDEFQTELEAYGLAENSKQ